jgi:hypothetical protein
LLSLKAEKKAGFLNKDEYWDKWFNLLREKLSETLEQGK